MALLARALVMFSGESGAPVASGIKNDAATADKPSYGLVRAALEVVFDDDSIVSHLPSPRVLRRRRRVLRVNGGMVPPDELPLRPSSKGAQQPGKLPFGPLPALIPLAAL